jgi:hypothetical protein
MPTCGQMVGAGVTSFPCIVDIPEGLQAHPGPHAVREKPNTMLARQRWEQANDGDKAREILRQTQSAPETFAMQNPGHTSTPVPGTNLQPDEYRRQNQPRVGDFGAVGDDVVTDCQHPYSQLEDQADGSVLCHNCGTTIRAAQAPPKPEVVQPPSADDPRRQAFVNETNAMREHLHAAVAEQVQEEPQPEPDPQPVLAVPPGATLRQRPGDQPLPAPDNPRPVVHELMIDDIKERLALGISRYGDGLKALNGRDTVLDAYEEALDHAVYLRTYMEERAEMLAIAEGVWSRLTMLTTSESTQLDPDCDRGLAVLVTWLRGMQST